MKSLELLQPSRRIASLISILVNSFINILLSFIDIEGKSLFYGLIGTYCPFQFTFNKPFCFLFDIFGYWHYSHSILAPSISFLVLLQLILDWKNLEFQSPKIIHLTQDFLFLSIDSLLMLKFLSSTNSCFLSFTPLSSNNLFISNL